MIIPAEGDSVETERWYASDVLRHYNSKPLFFSFGGAKWGYDLMYWRIAVSIKAFMNEFENVEPIDTKLELHAQGGFGAIVACMMTELYPKRVARIFFIGGAPCEAMNFIEKFFHRHISWMWYYSRIPYFADDPNPKKDSTVAAIKKSSSQCMQADRKLYCKQLQMIGRWMPKKPLNVEAYFVPNGDAPRPSWRYESYNNKKAAELWQKYGVKPLPKPGGGFSFYSLMPSEELFKVMDQARQF